MPLTKEDLYKNMYDYDTLKANIYCVSLMDILKTQKLNSDFCVKYILNPHFQLTQEEQKITLEIVKKYEQNNINEHTNTRIQNINDKIAQYNKDKVSIQNDTCELKYTETNFVSSITLPRNIMGTLGVSAFDRFSKVPREQAKINMCRYESKSPMPIFPWKTTNDNDVNDITLTHIDKIEKTKMIPKLDPNDRELKGIKRKHIL